MRVLQEKKGFMDWSAAISMKENADTKHQKTFSIKEGSGKGFFCINCRLVTVNVNVLAIEGWQSLEVGKSTTPSKARYVILREWTGKKFLMSQSEAASSWKSKVLQQGFPFLNKSFLTSWSCHSALDDFVHTGFGVETKRERCIEKYEDKRSTYTSGETRKSLVRYLIDRPVKVAFVGKLEHRINDGSCTISWRNLQEMLYVYFASLKSCYISPCHSLNGNWGHRMMFKISHKIFVKQCVPRVSFHMREETRTSKWLI